MCWLRPCGRAVDTLRSLSRVTPIYHALRLVTGGIWVSIIILCHKQKGHPLRGPLTVGFLFTLWREEMLAFSGGEVARVGMGRARRLKAAVYFLRALIAALRRCATQRPENSREWQAIRAERLHRFESKLRGGQGLVCRSGAKPQHKVAPTSASGS